MVRVKKSSIDSVPFPPPPIDGGSVEVGDDVMVGSNDWNPPDGAGVAVGGIELVTLFVPPSVGTRDGLFVPVGLLPVGAKLCTASSDGAPLGAFEVSLEVGGCDPTLTDGASVDGAPDGKNDGSTDGSDVAGCGVAMIGAGVGKGVGGDGGLGCTKTLRSLD